MTGAPLYLVKRFLATMRFGAGSSIVWLSGVLDGWMYMAVYAVKAFLPIYGLLEGFNILASVFAHERKPNCSRN